MDIPDDVINALKAWYAAQDTVLDILAAMPSVLDEGQAEVREQQRRALTEARTARDEAEETLWEWWKQAESPIQAWKTLRDAAGGSIEGTG